MGTLKKVAEAESAPRLKYCAVVRRIVEIWDALDEEDREFVTVALDPTTRDPVNGAAFTRALATIGVHVNNSAISGHRKGVCPCKGATPPWVN